MDVLKVIEQQKKVYLNLGLINKLMELSEVEKMIIEEHMKGRIIASNSLKGAVFTIVLEREIINKEEIENVSK